MKIVFFGTPHFVIPILDTLSTHFTLIGIVTTPDTLQGRKKIITPTPVKSYVIEKQLEVEILTPDKLDDKVVDILTELKPDLFVVAAYGKIIPQKILDIPTFGAINIHPSLLPKFRGPSPIQTTLLSGDEETGVTIIKMDEKMDHGPILVQEKVKISLSDTFESLHNSLFLKASDMIPKTLSAYVKGSLIPQEQNHTNATYCRIITKEDGYFDCNKPPSNDILDRMIRAYYPWPTAWTRITIPNGEERIIKFLPNRFIQPEGKKPMSIKDFFNGYPEMKQLIDNLLIK